MKTAIITYDLKNVQPHDNILVKAELAKFTNTHTSVVSDNLLNTFPEWVRMSFPTLCSLQLLVILARLNPYWLILLKLFTL